MHFLAATLTTACYLFELGLEDGVAERRLPLQLPAAVLPQVEELENLLQLHHLQKHQERHDIHLLTKI